MLQHMSKLRAY